MSSSLIFTYLMYLHISDIFYRHKFLIIFLILLLVHRVGFVHLTTNFVRLSPYRNTENIG